MTSLRERSATPRSGRGRELSGPEIVDTARRRHGRTPTWREIRALEKPWSQRLIRLSPCLPGGDLRVNPAPCPSPAPGLQEGTHPPWRRRLAAP